MSLVWRLGHSPINEALALQTLGPRFPELRFEAQVWWNAFVSPVWGRQRWVDPCSSLVSQASPSKSQASPESSKTVGRLVSKEQINLKRWTAPKGWHLRLFSSLHMYVCVHTCTHMCTHVCVHIAHFLAWKNAHSVTKSEKQDREHI